MYSLNKKQSHFWKTLFDENGLIRTDNNYTEFALWGGYGSGKTMICLLAIKQICEKYPGTPVYIIRETWDQLDRTVIKDWNDMFKYKGYKFYEGKKIIKFPNGSRIDFASFDKPHKILGSNTPVMMVSQAEAIPEALFVELFGRQRGDFGIPKPIIITEGNPADSWAKKRYADPKTRPSTVFYSCVSTYDNRKFLDAQNPHYIVNLENTLSPMERKRKMEGDWDSSDDMVFSHFNNKMNVIPPIEVPKKSRIVIGGDYGYRNPATFVWIYKDYDGRLIVFDEFYYAEQALESLAHASRRHGWHPVIYDFSTKRPESDGVSTWDKLQALGVPLIESNKDELRNIAVVNQLFKTGNLFITENCVNLIQEIRRYKWAKARNHTQNLKETPVDKDNHAIDALLYAVAFIEGLSPRVGGEDAMKYTIKYYAERKTQDTRENIA